MKADGEIASMSHGVRVMIGSIGTSFLIAAVFWAGATYNRVASIESQLASIQVALAKVGNISALEVKAEENQRRIDRLENMIQQLK